MTKEDLIQQLKSGEYHLSATSLKQFASSPRDFVKYKLKRPEDKDVTDDMKMGTLFESYLLDTPHDLKIFDRALLPEPDSDLRNTKNKKYMEGLKTELGKNNLVDKVIDNVARNMADRTRRHPIVSQLLNRTSEYQKELKWVVNGVNLLGYEDAVGDDIIIDFKKCKDARFQKFQYDIIDWEYRRQVAMYWDAEGRNKQVFIVGCDPSGQVCPVEITIDTLNAYVKEYHELIESFIQCIELDAFDAGYEWFYEGTYEL